MLKIYHYLTGSFVIITVMILTLMFAAACGHGQQNELKQTAVDSLIKAAFAAGNYERVLTLCDSLEQRGDISLYKAASERGSAYQFLNKSKAEEKELRRALLEKPKNAEDSLAYFLITFQLVDNLQISGDYDEALQMALSAIDGLRKMDREHPSEEVSRRLMGLTSEVGTIQMFLGMKEEADKMFEESYSYAKKMSLETPVAYERRFRILQSYIISYVNAGEYATAEKWLNRQDSVVALIKEGRGLAPADSESLMDRSYLSHVYVAAGLDRSEEFNRAVAAFRTTKYAQSNLGKVNLASALFSAKHYAKAADAFAELDQHFAEYDLELSLEHLSSWYGEKFRANYKAGRRDTALAVANLIIENLDSAIAKQKKGVPASLFMAQSARLFRTLATEGMMPADIAMRMNNELAENNERGMFVTMFMGLLHLDTGRLDYCNCGHNPPVLDGRFLEMKYENCPLGLWEGAPFDGETTDDIRGRQLLIYTDGLNEAENGQMEQFGDDHLLELMADTKSLTSREVIDKLKAAVKEHRASAEPNDDLTLMCITLKQNNH